MRDAVASRDLKRRAPVAITARTKSNRIATHHGVQICTAARLILPFFWHDFNARSDSSRPSHLGAIMEMLGAIGYSAMLAWMPSLFLLAYLLIDLPEASENIR